MNEKRNKRCAKTKQQSTKRQESFKTAGQPDMVATVLHQLTHEIIGGRFEPGSVLPPEAELAKSHDVSRTVIRESMRSLRAHGLVEMSQGKPARVRTPDPKPEMRRASARSADFQSAVSRISNPHGMVSSLRVGHGAHSADWKPAIQQVGNLRYKRGVALRPCLASSRLRIRIENGFPMARLIDLSHPLEHGQRNFPWDPKISVIPHNTVASIGYNITQISLSTHQGTHLDAPFHFYNDGKTVDRIRLEQFYGPATLVDLAPGSHLKARTPLTVEMFEPHAKQFQRGAKIIYRTGWSRKFSTPEFFSDFPTLTLEAARWIAARRIALLGMDTPTPSTDLKECHHILLKRGVQIVIVEGLTNLEKLPAQFTFIGFPLNIKGRDGAPIRAVAVIK